MTEVLRYEVGSGTVLVEAADNSYGVDHPARNEQGILDTGRRLEDALASGRPAARGRNHTQRVTAMASFHDRSDAGRRLGKRLASLRGRDVVVLGLPRG